MNEALGILLPGWACAQTVGDGSACAAGRHLVDGHHLYTEGNSNAVTGLIQWRKGAVSRSLARLGLVFSSPAQAGLP